MCCKGFLSTCHQIDDDVFLFFFYFLVYLHVFFKLRCVELSQLPYMPPHFNSDIFTFLVFTLTSILSQEPTLISDTFISSEEMNGVKSASSYRGAGSDNPRDTNTGTSSFVKQSVPELICVISVPNYSLYYFFSRKNELLHNSC